MRLEHILDRLERAYLHLTNEESSEDSRIFRTECMLDALICHVRDAVKREKAEIEAVTPRALT